MTSEYFIIDQLLDHGGQYPYIMEDRYVVKLKGLNLRFKEYTSHIWKDKQKYVFDKLDNILGKNNWGHTSPENTNVFLKNESDIKLVENAFHSNYNGFFKATPKLQAAYRQSYVNNRFPWEPECYSCVIKCDRDDITEIVDWCIEQNIKFAACTWYYYGPYTCFMINDYSEFLLFKLRWE